MRLILEKDDLVKILNKEFSENFDPARVQVRAEPFEVELTGLPLAVTEAAVAAPVSAPVTKAKAPPAPAAPPVPRAASPEHDGLSSNWTISPPTTVPEPEPRPLTPNQSHEPPPYDFDEADPAVLIQESQEIARQLDEERARQE